MVPRLSALSVVIVPLCNSTMALTPASPIHSPERRVRHVLCAKEAACLVHQARELGEFMLQVLGLGQVGIFIHAALGGPSIRCLGSTSTRTGAALETAPLISCNLRKRAMTALLEDEVPADAICGEFTRPSRRRCTRRFNSRCGPCHERRSLTRRRSHLIVIGAGI